MPSAPIPFVNQQASGLEELGGACPFAMNVVADPNGVVRRRPGISTYDNAVTTQVDASGLDAIYSTLDDTVVAVSSAGPERSIYRVTAGGVLALGGGLPGCGLRGVRRPSIAETDMLLVFAGGQEMQKVELATWNSARLGGSPPPASHVAAIAMRLCANDTLTYPSMVRYSDVATGKVSYAGHEVWSFGGIGLSGYFSADARPDPVQAIAENTNEVFVFGTGTTQVFAPQGDIAVPFAPVSSREVGCSAPASVVKVDQDFFWLDHKRRFVKSDGRSFDIISDPIQLTLDDMGYSADCWGFQICEGPYDALVWTFPTDGRTFVYQKGAGWGQWAGWNGNWTPFKARCAKMLQGRSDTIVGTTDGYIGKIDLHTNTDLGTTIRANVRTGFINRDTDSRKRCKGIRVVVRRGGASSADSTCTLKFRDTPDGPWSTPLPITIGTAGDRESVVQFRSLGFYRSRQWEFEFSADEDIELVRVTEDYEVLEV